MNLNVSVHMTDRSKAYTATYLANARRLVQTIANDVRNAAIESITQGAPAGIYYTGRGKGLPNHRASAPGQPPASDTGNLANQIIIQVDSDGLGASIISRAKYSNALEFGATNTTTGALIEARPFMAPAAEQARAKAKRKGHTILRARGVRRGGSAGARRRRIA